MAENFFRGDPRLSPRERRAMAAARRGPHRMSGGTVTAVSLAPSVDADTGLSTLYLGTVTGEIVSIDDNVTIEAIAPLDEGRIRRLFMGDNDTLVHNAVSFIMEGGMSINSIAGDVAEFYSLGSGNWRCWRYTRGGTPSMPSYNIPSVLLVADLFGESIGYTYLFASDSGIGDTITFTATGVQSIKGHDNALSGNPVPLGFLVLVNNLDGSHLVENGLYECTTEGAVGVAAVWTRSVLMDTGNKFDGAMVSEKQWASFWIYRSLTGDGSPPVIGTALITFEQILTKPDFCTVLSESMFGWNVKAKTNSYTLTFDDLFSIITFNKATAVTCTVPKTVDIVQPFPFSQTIGGMLWVVGIGAGLVTLAPAAGVTINIPSNESLVLARYQMACLVNTATDVWEVKYSSRPPDGSTLSVNASGQMKILQVTSAVVDSSIIIAAGTNPFTGDQSLGSHKLTSVTDPVSAQDAATKNYVDLAVAALAAKNECQAATTVALAASTYNNVATPPSGVGATITLTVAAVLILDGYTPALGDRLLIKNQASAFQNGIYTLTTVGVLGVTQAVLTRGTDFDHPGDGINGALVYVLSGTANSNTLWTCTTVGSITFGTTNINWSQFTGTTYTADETTLHLTGTVFSIKTTTGSGSTVALATSPVLVTPLLGTPTSGVLTNCTGTASGLTAGTVTTNANLTGPITSVGNATSVATTFAFPGQATPSASGGKVAYDTTLNTIVAGIGVAATPVNVWLVGTLFTATGSVSSTTTAQTVTMVGTGVGTMTVPANMAAAGTTLRLRAKGVFTTAATQGTLTWIVKIGTTTVASTGAQTPPPSRTNGYWELECDLVFRTVGGSGTVFVQGLWSIQGLNIGAVTANTFYWPIRGNSADPPAVVTIDTTAGNLIDIQLTTSNANNTLTCNHVTLERML